MKCLNKLLYLAAAMYWPYIDDTNIRLYDKDQLRSYETHFEYQI